MASSSPGKPREVEDRERMGCAKKVEMALWCLRKTVEFEVKQTG